VTFTRPQQPGFAWKRDSGYLGAYLRNNHGLDCEALRRGRETGAKAMLEASSSARDKAIARRVATRRAVAAKAWASSSLRS
jgi:hypothetical protein